MSCTEQIIARISDPAAFSSWKTTTTNSVQGIVASTSEATVSLLESDVSNTLNCLETKIAEARGTFSDISTLYTQHSALQGEYQTKTDALKISQDRVKLLTHPEQHTTVYESWFPLHRPLQTSSLLLLIVTSLFFFSVFVGLLARQLGLFVDLGYMYTPAAPGTIMAYLMSKMNPVTLGLGAALIVFISATIYFAVKQSKV
jgi:hypothetical protein